MNENIANYSDKDIQELKEKYLNELKNAQENPIKDCLELLFKAATVKDNVNRLEIANDLSKFLYEPKGVINLFLAIIDFDTSSQKNTTHNQRFIAIANIITCLPSMFCNYNDYCASITNQLRPLLLMDNPKYVTLASIIIKSLIESPHSKKFDNIAGLILELLAKRLYANDFSDIVEIYQDIIIIDNLIQNHLPIKHMVPLFSNLFHCLLTFVDSDKSKSKNCLKKDLVSILNGLKPAQACCLLERTIFYQDYTREYSDDILRETITTLIVESENESLILEFFFYINEIMHSLKDDWSRRISASIFESILLDTTEQHSFNLSSIIATNQCKSLELITRTLMNHVKFLKSDAKEFESNLKLVIHSLDSCLEILEVLVATSTFADEIILQKCSAVLDNLEKLFSSRSDGDTKGRIYQNIKSLIKNLSDVKKYSRLDDNCCKVDDCNSRKEYDSILKDLNDKLVPVRVHALIRFKEKIMLNEVYFVERISQILPMIEASLDDEEPYVYSACINLLTEMSVRKTDHLLPKLTELYLNEELHLQHRMNVGEVLVRLTKQMNELTPFYAQKVMHIFYKGCRDSQELMRVSSYVNIGLICQNLADSLGNYMVDILTFIQETLDGDSIQVKCAAVDLLRTTLIGLDRFRLESIQREIGSIYKLLKSLRSRTLDDNLCKQVDLALDEIDRLAKELLGGTLMRSEELVKNIRVLS